MSTTEQAWAQLLREVEQIPGVEEITHRSGEGGSEPHLTVFVPSLLAPSARAVAQLLVGLRQQYPGVRLEISIEGTVGARSSPQTDRTAPERARAA